MNETLLLELINSTGGIPLRVTTVTQTAPWQFYLTLVISSFGLLWFFSIIGRERMRNLIGLIYLKWFKLFNRTGEIVVIKHTMQDLFSASMINRTTLEKIQKILIKLKGKPFKLILYTPGGEVFSASYISRLLEQYSGKIKSYVPTFAMSGGTLLALSTDEIYMNDYSCLGPVDPQLGTLFKFGSAKSWKEIVRIKGKKAEDSSISMKFMGEQYTKSLKETINKLLENKTNKEERKKLVELFVSGEIEHGFNLTKEYLRNKGLEIKDLSNDSTRKILKLVKYLPEGVTSTKN